MFKNSQDDTVLNGGTINKYFEKEVIESDKKNNQKVSHHQYKCKEVGCFKKFYSEYNLKIHVRTVHYRMREHICKICERSYLHKKNLVEHIKREHPDYVECPKTKNMIYRFPSSQNLSSQKYRSDSENGESPQSYWQGNESSPLSEPKSLASCSDSAKASCMS